MLYYAMEGFSQLLLHSKRPFYIKEKMIGINRFGIIKVWCNGNYALNTLEYLSAPFVNQRESGGYTESQMIEELTKIINSRVRRQTGSERAIDRNYTQMLNQLNNRWRQDFQHKKEVIYKYYMPLSNKIKSIRSQLLQKLATRYPDKLTQVERAAIVGKHDYHSKYYYDKGNLTIGTQVIELSKEKSTITNNFPKEQNK